MFYARRAKLYGAFSKFYYQRNELNYYYHFDLVQRFINIIKKYDFWESKIKWPPLKGLYDEIIFIEGLIKTDNIAERKKLLKNKFDKSEIFSSLTDDEVIGHLIIKPLWDRLCNLSNIYEEICKEWFLPTYFWHELYMK